MSKTIVETLADFAADTQISRLPSEVISEAKRDLLDCMGCALAAINQPKGLAGIEMAKRVAGTVGEATVIGTSITTTVFGAAFANAELINTLDMDSILLPGHASPYVVPGTLATGEVQRRSGKDMIAAVAVSHELAYRFGTAMDLTRDFRDGKVAMPPVVGYTATIFGATAAAGKLRGLTTPQLANAIGIAAASTPVNSHRAWLMHAPATTIKYILAGGFSNAVLTAVEMADLGHRGDLVTLDDREFGYPRFIGTTKWEPERITLSLGEEWRFPKGQMYKPYPHCRCMHGPIDLVLDLIAQHDLKVGEIDSLQCYGEDWAYVLPTFLSRDIQRVEDAQFSFAHGLSVAAHRVKPGIEWQDPKVVFDPSVMGLMDKITLEAHPDSVKALGNNLSSRPSRIDIQARGRTFSAEKMFPKGTPSPDGESYMTNEELIQKFRHNAEGAISAAAIDSVVEQMMNLEQVEDFSAVMRLLRKQ